MEKLAEQAASEPGHCDKEQPEDTCVSCGRAGTEGWGCKLCNAMYHPNCVGSAEGTEWECSLCRGGPDLGILRAELDNDMPIDRSQVRSFGEHDIFLKVPRVSERGEHELNCYESLRVCGVQETATAICWGSVVVQGQQILVLEQLDPLTREEFVEEVPAALSCIRAIHQAGIVVVDIKPEHFRRRRQGAKGVVVVDFDLARLNGKLPPRASEQPSSFFREYVITPNEVATATFVGTLRYAPLSGHLGLAPTEVGDLVCLLFSVWHIKAGLPWSGSPDKLVQDWLETVDAIKRRAAERDRKGARAELEKWVSWERKKMEGTLLNGLIGDLKLGLLGKGQATVGGAEYVAAAYRVGSLSMEEARFTILEAEAAAHCGAAGVKRGVEALTGLIYRVANMVVDNPPQTSPAHKHSKEGRVLPGGVRNPLGGADDPSERKLSAGNEVPDSGGSAGGDSGSGISSTSRLGRLGGLSTTEQEKRLQEATGAAEEEVRKALGVALEVPIVQKAGKLIRGDGVRESKLGGSFIVTPQLLAFRPAAKDYEIDGFVEDDRAPASLLEALGATDLLEVTQSRLHPTATFPPALRVQCPGQTETGGTDVFVEVIASDHPRSVARKFGQIEAGVCMTRPHPLLLSLKPALLLVAYAGKEEIGPTVQACLRQEGAADLLPYNRFASLLGLAALVHVKTPLAVALAKKVKRRLENLQNTSTMRSYLEVRLEGASITPPKTVEVIIEGAADDTSIELQQPLTIAALIEGSCEGFDLTRSEIKGFKIPSPARPGKKTWLQNDWQLQRDLDIVEIVLRKDVLHKGGPVESDWAVSPRAPAAGDPPGRDGRVQEDTADLPVLGPGEGPLKPEVR